MSYEYPRSAGAGQYGDLRLPAGMSMQQEFEQLKADYEMSIEKLNQTMNSIKNFWSPELKRERQLRREESARIAQLERALQSGGTIGGVDVGQMRMEISSRDERIRQLTAILEDNMQSGLGGVTGQNADSRVRELEDTVRRLQEMIRNKDQQMLTQVDASGRYALENALRKVDEKQSRVSELEDELSRMRIQRTGQPRDFTDKSISSHEMLTLRMKMERSETALAERSQELASIQTRMRTAEETAGDARGHLQLLREQLTNKEQQCALLQGDVEALRSKLEGKNQVIEQREARITTLEKDLSGSKADVGDKSEQMRQTEMRMNQLVGRVESLETSLRDKEQELDKAKVRLLSHPDVIREKELREQIEHAAREKQRLQDHIDQLRGNCEKDRIEQQTTYQNEVRQLQSTIDNLQKELLDRDVLLESQNEKIGDMGRDLSAALQRLKSAMVDKGADELRKEVEGARSEVEKLLKMVRQLEKDNTQLNSQCKQLQGVVERHGADPMGTLSKVDRSGVNSALGGSNAHNQTGFMKRIEELEEALRESVSITAEREVHLSQQKHFLQQVNQQLSDARRENGELRKRLTDGGGMDREQMMKAFDSERRQHLEQLLHLKQEALLSAIGEKDAHLALLEKGRAPREEIETIRRHKEALMRKLKQENERRALVVRPESASGMVLPGAAVAAGGTIGTQPQPSPRQGDIMATSGELDDSEGIWA